MNIFGANLMPKPLLCKELIALLYSCDPNKPVAAVVDFGEYEYIGIVTKVEKDDPEEEDDIVLFVENLQEIP